MGRLHGLPEEAPRHQVAVRSFCMDSTEVTLEAFQRCQQQGKCTPSHRGPFCNTDHSDRLDHPVNCVDWHQAQTFCQQAGARLPTEREWEYAAKGGSENRSYAWGEEPPEGRCCYNHEGTCKVKSYPSSSFDLYDLTGNVWEWTASAFGPYPAEILEGPIRVYRGGSFSRRFPKWMRNDLRNRFRAEEWGAHLGFRCAQDLPGSTCPPGSSQKQDGTCIPEGVTEPSTPVLSSSRPWIPPEPKAKTEAVPLSTSRDPRFDGDCSKYKPGHPIAFIIKGGSFAERQHAKGACINRDVGVGFNSICCAR